MCELKNEWGCEGSLTCSLQVCSCSRRKVVRIRSVSSLNLGYLSICATGDEEKEERGGRSEEGGEGMRKRRREEEGERMRRRRRKEREEGGERRRRRNETKVNMTGSELLTPSAHFCITDPSSIDTISTHFREGVSSFSI